MPKPSISIAVALCGALLGLASVAQAADGRDVVTIALDPGHGGVDPGAEALGVNESDLVLDFARRLAGLLTETGRFDAVLTRDGDHFVSLDQRLSEARRGGAEVFISIHADAIPEGGQQASGLTIYTLDSEDVPQANARLIERHDETDILTDVDLSDAGEDVSTALIALSRQESFPRSQMLAQSLLTTFAAGDVSVNNRPHRHGGFTVLKAAEMPSVLIELGFLSNARDRERLMSEEWLREAALAIRDGLLLWVSEDRLFRAQALQ
jgi:N-acetylmuramoyl-L-alanine amidase